MYQVKLDSEMKMEFETMEEAAGFCKTFMEHATEFVPSATITYFKPLKVDEEDW